MREASGCKRLVGVGGYWVLEDSGCGRLVGEEASGRGRLMGAGG